MLNSIATVSLGGTLREKLESISAAGFKAAEIFENDLVASDMSPETVRSLMRDLDLECVVYQPFRDFEGLSGQRRIRAFDRAERKFDLMQRLGTDLILVCSTVNPESDGDHGRIADDFRELGDRAGKRGLRVGYEALAWGRHINDHRDAAAIVRAVDHESVGLILDSFHSLARGVPLSSLRLLDPKKIFLVQMADAPAMQMDILQWSRHYRCMPLQGSLPVTEYVAILEEIGYSGPLSLEIFNDRFRSGYAKTIALDGMRSLELVRDEAARRNSTTPVLPEKADGAAVKFVEFSVSEEEAAPFRTMLQGLGMRSVGRHRTLDAELWRSHDVNIILNSEASTFAGSYALVHGPSLCSVGIQVEDQEALLKRASALSVPVLVEPGGASRLSLPALRGVGGSLVYVLDKDSLAKLWREEFDIITLPEESVEGAVQCFDHLGCVVHADEFLSWTLYWKLLFDVVMRDEVDLIDPAGIVQSQAVESRNGPLRITFNGSLSTRTLATRFVRQSFGAGFQHIALATQDIFSAAEMVHRAGLQVLEIPENYYDDLIARFGLDDALIARMRQHNILYDRDENGNEFFQIFSRAFKKSFFFEIVQRRGYGGYGVPNVQVRLTAQRRAGGAPDTYSGTGDIEI